LVEIGVGERQVYGGIAPRLAGGVNLASDVARRPFYLDKDFIPNDRLLEVAEQKTSILNAFRMADDILRQGVQGITDLITVPGLINLDFADVRTIMTNAGSALMGIGVASGDGRAQEAARSAISSPLLESSIDGAKGVLLNISGGVDLGLFEVNEAAEIIASAADPEANIIFGAVIDDSLGDELRVTVIASGFEFGVGKPQKRVVQREVQAAQPEKTVVFESDELDIPTFLRNR
ncbi:MAG: hypothetical protein M1337_01985, partial [Actinobacteria bacterium]|nr:hypothetical protein [Actinomycetota bacterium]